ncbi:hypothetical protein [Rhizobium sp. BK176]|uniref:hypothetical protein n=1 Tax=Rhizobium sp. BK176 TaxID=2587071 RepID=UPI00216755B7|nr:hypothetical protein [Rhizobium sp. BK176]MCS4089334.1 hypothetical protein [Rhizobium sp. BK176]
MKSVKHKEKDFYIQGVASAYEHGYEVSFKGKDDTKASVQFRVFLDSAMKLVAIANRFSQGASVADITAAREVVNTELASNPSVFHIEQNASYDMQRLRRSAEQAWSTRNLDVDDPLQASIISRHRDLEQIVMDARKWSEHPQRQPFAQFMEEHRIEAKKRDFDVEENLDIGDEFRFHPPMGPIELYCAVRCMEQKPESVVVVDDFAELTPVRCAVGERTEFSWPRLDTKLEDALSITSARPYELAWKIAEHITEKNGVVMGWTRHTETAAFETILDWFEKSGLDPKLVIGSPEGTFSGRASAIRLALGSSPTLSQTARAPALR